MQHGVFSNGWSPKNGDPSHETSYSIPPITGRGRPQTIFTEVKKKDRNLQVRDELGCVVKNISRRASVMKV